MTTEPTPPAPADDYDAQEKVDAFIAEHGYSPKRRPAICTPIARSPVQAFNNSYTATNTIHPTPMVTMEGHANTPRARNIVLHQAYHAKDKDGNYVFTDFIFIDDDI